MLITEAIRAPTFANHESFHLRYGWLKKAYDAVVSNPKIFVSDEAPITLGVGKNMVRSIRFWALSTKVIEHQRRPQHSEVTPTKIGHAIFDNKRGLDPYLEDPQTLWLLHWLLLTPPCRIPVWWIILNEFPATNVRIAELAESIQHRIMNMPEWKTPSPKSIKKDVDVFIHTYTTEQGRLLMEDYLNCPFRQMRLIRQGSRKTVRFVYGKKYGMTPHIVAYACLDFIIQLGMASRNISVTRLATEAGGVGNAFKMGETDLGGLLAEACRTSNHIKMENINGVPHLMFDNPTEAAIEALYTAYGKKSSRLGSEAEVPLVS